MKKISTIIAIIALIQVVFCINISGQTLKSRTWQSQDTTSTRYQPSTLVLNLDGTYYSLKYIYSDDMTLISFHGDEGTYTETKNSLNLIRYYNGRPIREDVYKITWLNSSEFTMVEGIKTHHYAELGTDGDFFTPKFLIPFIEEEQSSKHKIDPCYKEIIAQNNTRRNRLKEEAVNSIKVVKNPSLIGTIWQMQVGKNKEESGRLKNISFGDDGVIREIDFIYANGYVKGTAGERKQNYREDSGEILVFNEKGTSSTSLNIKWENENQITIGYYTYTRFNSDKDAFSKDYLQEYTQRMIENAKPVYPVFLEVLADQYRSVRGKIYLYKGDNVKECPYVSFEFDKVLNCRAKANGFFSLGLKDYTERESNLLLRKRNPFKDVNRGEWEEKLDIKWINSQEFVLTKDGKSYNYILQGLTPETTPDDNR